MIFICISIHKEKVATSQQWNKMDAAYLYFTTINRFLSKLNWSAKDHCSNIAKLVTIPGNTVKSVSITMVFQRYPLPCSAWDHTSCNFHTTCSTQTLNTFQKLHGVLIVARTIAMHHTCSGMVWLIYVSIIWTSLKTFKRRLKIKWLNDPIING